MWGRGYEHQPHIWAVCHRHQEWIVRKGMELGRMEHWIKRKKHGIYVFLQKRWIWCLFGKEDGKDHIQIFKWMSHVEREGDLLWRNAYVQFLDVDVSLWSETVVWITDLMKAKICDILIQVLPSWYTHCKYINKARDQVFFSIPPLCWEIDN